MSDCDQRHPPQVVLGGVPVKSLLSTLRLRLTVIINYNKLKNTVKREGAKDVRVPVKSYYLQLDSDSKYLCDVTNRMN